MTILIESFEGDIHAAAVAWGLRSLGEDCLVNGFSEFPANLNLSVKISNRFPVQRLARQPDADNNSSIDLSNFSAIWHRRKGQIALPENLHEADVEHTQGECHELMTGFRAIEDSGIFQVNPIFAGLRADRKLLQLQYASAIGFVVPDTIAGNDPELIRELAAQHQGRIIFKPFYSNAWYSHSMQRFVNYVGLIDNETLQNDAQLRCSPGIYQAYIDKAYEVRAFVMGRTIIAAKIYSQEKASTKGDWRFDPEGITFERYLLPQDTTEKIFEFMDAFGIVTGSFDLIVTPEGKYIFLEINEGGQFLFIEDINPKIPTLSAFVEFLRSRDPHFRYREDQNGITMAAFMKTEDFRFHIQAMKSETFRRNVGTPDIE